MRIIFIGGTTGAGKSFIGRILANEAHALYIEGDALRVSLQEEAGPNDPVNVFRLRPPTDYLSEDVTTLCAMQSRVSAETCDRVFAPALDEALRDDRYPAVLLEGDDVLPAFARQWQDRANVQTIFAIELDPAMPLARSKAPANLSSEQKNTFAAVHHCRGRELADQAASHSMAIVAPRDEAGWRDVLHATRDRPV